MLCHTWNGRSEKHKSERIGQVADSQLIRFLQLQGSVLLISRFNYRQYQRSTGMDEDDSSSMFFEWAMETLQHEHQPAADATYAVLQELLQNGPAPAVQDCATDSWSSGDSDRGNTPGGAVVETDGWPSSHPPVSWQFTSNVEQPTIHDEATPTAPERPPEPEPEPEAAHRSPPLSRKRSIKSASSSTVTGQSSPEPVQEHARAERKRRETINRGFIELSSVIPGLKKMDKATILSDAARYVKKQQEKLKELEGRGGARSIDSVVLVKRPCIAAIPDGATTTSSLPEIEARISESDVMVKIHCEDRKGMLVRLLAEVEEIQLTITHNNVIPCFPACTLSITIMAKVDEGFNVTPEDIIEKLHAVLR